MQEKWKKIGGYGNYSISNLGRIRNNNTGSFLSPTIRSSTCDYYSILLPIGNGKYRHKNVHRLVAEAFVDGQNDGLVVNHIDGDKHNNRADNLEWTTRSQNDKHAFANNLRKSTPEQIVAAINSRKRRVVNLTLGLEYESLADAARAIGGRIQGVHKCVSGQRETYYGMTFAYIDS